MDQKHYWNWILAEQGLSSLNLHRKPKKKRRSYGALYKQYLEHPTAQYQMAFSEWKKGRNGRSPQGGL